MEAVLLVHPAFARLFPENAGDALHAELSSLLGIPVQTEPVRIAGADAFRLTVPPLTPESRAIIAHSAAFYALFSREGQLLRPEETEEWRLLPDTLPALLKYPGKTNERFTRYLVNLAEGVCTTGRDRKTLLDPMCGQGTTLFEAAVRGHDAVGLEILDPPVHKGTDYFVKYLQTGRYKHRKTQEKRSADGRTLARVTEIRWASERGDWETERTRVLRFLTADACDGARLLPKKSADLLVCDLPYGVQHGGRGESGYRDLTKLIGACLPALSGALKKGAGCALSYNTLTVRRDALRTLFASAGFEVAEELSDGRLCHRVDQAIMRDILVASKL